MFLWAIILIIITIITVFHVPIAKYFIIMSFIFHSLYNGTEITELSHREPLTWINDHHFVYISNTEFSINVIDQ